MGERGGGRGEGGGGRGREGEGVGRGGEREGEGKGGGGEGDGVRHCQFPHHIQRCETSTFPLLVFFGFIYYLLVTPN